MSVLKTYQCEECGKQSDEFCTIEDSDRMAFCNRCDRETSQFVVMNTRGLHYRFMSGWTDDVIEKSVRLEESWATYGEGGERVKGRNGEDLSAKQQKSAKREERNDRLKWAKNKRKTGGKIILSGK